ncbi:MAG: 3-keto-disaccharide hydrolase [bacterium]
MMKHTLGFFLLIFLACSAGTIPTLSLEDQNAGWKLLFDGKTFEGWRGFKMEGVPKGWQITKNGELYFKPKGGGDLMTVAEFQNFELQLEWKISKGGNSGIFFWVTEDDEYSWKTGPEMQVLDNTHHKDGLDPKTAAGANYALHAPSREVTRQAGEFNEARILVKGTHIEHWLNGAKIVEYEIGSTEWETLVAASKFGELPKYGRNRKGHIVLQDHGDKVWYRNIKIRLL